MRLPETFLRFGRWLSGLSSRVRPGGDAVANEAKARARFWDGVREGRAEAEARSSEQNR